MNQPAISSDAYFTTQFSECVVPLGGTILQIKQSAVCRFLEFDFQIESVATIHSAACFLTIALQELVLATSVGQAYQPSRIQKLKTSFRVAFSDHYST